MTADLNFLITRVAEIWQLIIPLYPPNTTLDETNIINHIVK
jgi:hypothetical protein